MSLEDIKAAYKPEEQKPLYIKDCEGWEANVKAYPEVMKYLQRNNCMEAYELYPNRFFYDKLQDRVVFVEYDTINSFKLATGRNISSYMRNIPKWYKYVALPGSYFIANSIVPTDSTYIVEDCASACSISRFGFGLALCGTSYNLYQLVTALMRKDIDPTLCKIVICLDPDAQVTAMKLQRDLEGFGKFKSVRIASLTNDAKYMELSKLKKELGHD